MPTLKQKKNGDYIVHKNTDSVQSAPPVGTFQVDPIAVRILRKVGVDAGDFIDNDTFWSLYDIGLVETGLTELEGFDLLEQAQFLSELLKTYPVDEIATSEPVLEIAANLDQVFAGLKPASIKPKELAEVLWDDIKEILSRTPFDPEVIFRASEILSLNR